MRSPAQRARDRSRPSASARGYGSAHQRLRAKWAARVKRGGVVCARCRRVIPADPRVPCPGIRSDGSVCGKVGCGWHLGHDDRDPTRRTYWGPEHACCNCGTSARARPRRMLPTVFRSNRW